MGGVLHGDLGKSIDTRQSVSHDIVKAFPKTLSITILAFIIRRGDLGADRDSGRAQAR